MILEVIVTTMNENILQLIDNFYKQFDNVIYFISHQIINKEANLYIKQVNKFLKKRADVKYFYYYEKGLSRNRNRSMEVSTGDICLVHIVILFAYYMRTTLSKNLRYYE